MEENRKKELQIPLSTLDMKDRRILRELFENGRSPYSAIAKRVGLSKEVVNYRIKRMFRRGLLLGFKTVIDVAKLGWQIYFITVRLKDIDNETEDRIIEQAKRHPNVAQVLRCIGTCDLILKVFVKTYGAVFEVMRSIEQEFTKNIDDYKSVYITEEQPVPLHFLYQPLSGEEKLEKPLTYRVGDIDLHLLKAIAQDARKSTTEIANETGVSREVAGHHLKRLEKSGIIKAYRPSAWSGSKSLGYNWYIIFLKLERRELNVKKQLSQFIQQHPNTTYLYASQGEHDLIFEIRLQTSDELNSVLMELRSIAKETLKSHELSIILKEFTYGYFPACMSNFY